MSGRYRAKAAEPTEADVAECVCGHGQFIHRDDRGHCAADVWVDIGCEDLEARLCTCRRFRPAALAKPSPPRPS